MNLKQVFSHSDVSKEKNTQIFIDLSRRYYKKCGLDFSLCNAQSQGNPLIVESAHQPNFLPVLNYFAKMLVGYKIAQENNGIFFHGFLDTDTTSEKWATKNVLPFLNKQGYVSFGFPSLRGTRKPFFLIDKPSQKDYEAAIGKISDVYTGKYFQKNTGSIETTKNNVLDVLRKAYDNAENLGELNSFMCSFLIAEVFKIYPLYYKFSDLTTIKEIYPHFLYFFDNCDKINESLKHLTGMRNQDSQMVQLWFQCDCGFKIKIIKEKSGVFRAACDGCKSAYSIDAKYIKDNLKKFSVNYLSRALLVSRFLGTEVYLAGKGSIDPLYGEYEMNLQNLAKNLTIPRGKMSYLIQHSFF